ncbi:hypothetical protein [Virgibacillus sp. SK37]|uniref:hypothetical protein n=1 Tax=Virgibacillus sp. SK37 TaxID=403957 RepID=UPI0004D1B55C|nr:hypothetical protein [Virgibacillus sp. SK37]AIF45634.1 hypothetical protein X953_18745 [Virgibacillus sp. SK37]
MGKYFGVTFNFEEYNYVKHMLTDHASAFNKRINIFLLLNIDMLEIYISQIDRTLFDRVLIYDHEELGSWENLKQFSLICNKYNLEWSILKQDLHSDVPLELDYLLEIV